MSTLKLLSLLMKTLAKPLSSSLKRRAATDPSFHTLCISVAQFYHSAEMRLKMRFMGYPTTKIRPLNDAKAVEVGSTVVGEGFLFVVGVGLIALEGWRGRKVERNRRDRVEERLEGVENGVAELREWIKGEGYRGKGIAEELERLRKAVDEMKCSDNVKSTI